MLRILEALSMVVPPCLKAVFSQSNICRFLVRCRFNGCLVYYTFGQTLSFEGALRGLEVDWKIITKSKKYKAGAGHCGLCLDEKLYILKNPGTINKRSEIISKCRHSRKFLVRHI